MLFVSTYPYALIKVARALGTLDGGPEAELALIEHERDKLGESRWPCFRTLGELQHVEPAAVVCDASGSIAQSRSRMAGRFLAAEQCDVWLTIDDDIFAGRETLTRLLEHARMSPQVIATVPYLLRDGRTASVGGLSGNRALTTGFGLLAMHRDAVARVGGQVPWAVDDKGLNYPALFQEYLEQAHWLGEDIAFSRRAYGAQVPIEVLPNAPVCHAGRWSRLEPDGTFSVDRATADS